MAPRPRKSCRWPSALTEVLLLGLLASSAHAADGPAAAAGSAAFGASPALTLDVADSMAAFGGTDLYLDVTVNGSSSGLAHFGQRDGKLWATKATLRQLGFVLPEHTADPVRLDSLHGVQVSFDQERQSVVIIAPLSLLKLPTHILDTWTTAPRKAGASPGLLLNYDLYGTRGGHGNGSLNAFTELRAFNGTGVLSSTSLSQASRAGDAWNNRSVRLDTSWSTSFPEEMLTLRIGDTLTATTSWSRSMRMGGVQIGTNFSLQPYRVTIPLPEFMGSATLPSRVELYVNGMKQYSGNVPAGPFQLNTVPGINGAGNAQVMLTNALGQVTTLDFSLYNTPTLLQKGLSDWSAELGVVRENYGLASFDYDDNPASSGTWRHGFSSNFTGEFHGEVTRDLTNAGAGGNWLLGSVGVVSASAAHSQSRGLSGSQYSLGYSWTSSRYNFGVNGMRADDDYRDTASLYGGPPPELSASAQAGFSTDHLGSFGLNYVHLRYQQQPASRYASAYWYKSAGRRMTLSLNVNQNLDQRRDRSFFLSLNLSLDDRIYMSAGVQHDGDRNLYTVNATQSVPTAGGFGWRAQLQQGEGTQGGQAELDYLGRYGQVQAGISNMAGSHYTYAGANGSVVLMGGGLFAARQIYGGFAVVSTDGVPNVPVKLENNLVGTTDRSGHLLVTPLNAYQNNKLSIDPMDLPAGVRITRVNTITTPTDRAGTLVRFGITPTRAASIILVDAAGKPLPVGSTVRVRGHHDAPALLGFDGVVYLDTLDVRNVLDVDTPADTCHVTFDYHKQGDGIPQIGPLTCREEQP